MRAAVCAVLLLYVATSGTNTARAQDAKASAGDNPAAVGVARSAPDTSPSQPRTLGDFLASVPDAAGPEVDSWYAEVPPELDKVVRLVSMDNFTSAAAEARPVYEAATDKREKARAAMWLGIAHGLQAFYYPDTGRETGTSATNYLKEAIQLDPAVVEAPDVARVMAEMVANGWASEDPATALQRAVQKAEETLRPVDFYFAGVISRRLSARAWGYSDTTEQDQKTLSLFAKAVARDPSRYESWSAYLPAMLPVGMHDLATTEAAKMYDHFKNLRTPLLADQGPAVLKINTSSYRTMKDDEDLLAEVAKQWPDAPMPRFEMAMRAIESTPTLAAELFPRLISDFENGTLEPTPREAGYYPSALYKWAFLLQSVERTGEALAVYQKVRELSPAYAEVNLNIGIVLAQLSDKESTGPKKLALLEESLNYVEDQEKYDYRGKAAPKAREIRQRLVSTIDKLKQELKDNTSTAAGQ